MRLISVSRRSREALRTRAISARSTIAFCAPNATRNARCGIRALGDTSPESEYRATISIAAARITITAEAPGFANALTTPTHESTTG